MVLISNGSVVLLKYNLNNVCDPNRVREPRRGGTQITEQFLYTTIYCGCQYESVDILYFLATEKTNTHYLRIKCVLQAHHENNAYYVRIKGALWYSAAVGQTLSFPTKSSAGAVALAELLSISAE